MLSAHSFQEVKFTINNENHFLCVPYETTKEKGPKFTIGDFKRNILAAVSAKADENPEFRVFCDGVTPEMLCLNVTINMFNAYQNLCDSAVIGFDQIDLPSAREVTFSLFDIHSYAHANQINGWSRKKSVIENFDQCVQRCTKKRMFGLFSQPNAEQAKKIVAESKDAKPTNDYELWHYLMRNTALHPKNINAGDPYAKIFKMLTESLPKTYEFRMEKFLQDERRYLQGAQEFLEGTASMPQPIAKMILSYYKNR